jgi:lipoprotein-releasing system ATP-binding protein
MSDMILYDVTDLWKSYSNGGRQVEVLKGIDFRVKAGETVAVTGPSGVGKSTLLHILGLLDGATSGTVMLGGIDVNGLNEADRAEVRNRRIGFVFQFFQLLPEFTALENAMMPGLIAGESPSALSQRAMELFDDLGIVHRAHHRPGELSGGEQQRAAIARALMMNPDVVLADEPTGNLDPDTGEEVEVLMRDLNRSRNTTLIVVTHKESLSRAMDRRVGLVGGRLEELQ